MRARFLERENRRRDQWPRRLPSELRRAARRTSHRPRFGGRFVKPTLAQAFRDAPAVVARHHHRAAAQRFERHVEREDLRLQPAARGTVADRLHFVVQVAQRAQLLDGRRHEARVLQDTVGHPHLLGHEQVVIQRLRRAGTRQIVELAPRGGGGNTLFDQGVKQSHQSIGTMRQAEF
ncbi:hypothetical protein BCEN4_240022 [Burkholderia cenocepacia]|nr:hypothetical protein BCEN4_240022 [Burkholderia cenocepacia]